MSLKNCIKCGIEIECGPKNRRKFCIECAKEQKKLTDRAWYERVVGTSKRKHAPEKKDPNRRRHTSVKEINVDAISFVPVTTYDSLYGLSADEKKARSAGLSYGQWRASL